MGRTNALLLSLVILTAMDAAGCICARVGQKTAFKGADAVFLGEVLEDGLYVIRARVVDHYKGAAGKNMEVSMVRDVACEYAGATPRGSRHLIYASRREDGLYSVSQCTGSAPESQAACALGNLRFRAWWWRSSLSSPRLLERLGVGWKACPEESRQ